jgi:hypothetical protein
VLAYRLSTDLAGVTPYLAGASADAGHDEWYRVAGVEAGFDTPPLNLLRIPSVRITGGAGYALDEPDRHDVRLYAGITYQP